MFSYVSHVAPVAGSCQVRANQYEPSSSWYTWSATSGKVTPRRTWVSKDSPVLGSCHARVSHSMPPSSYTTSAASRYGVSDRRLGKVNNLAGGAGGRAA